MPAQRWQPALRRWWWVPLLLLGGLGLKAYVVGGMVQGAARDRAAAAADIGVERVEVFDGLNIRLTGFVDESSRDQAVAAVDALDSSWEVEGLLDGAATTGPENTEPSPVTTEPDVAAVDADQAGLELVDATTLAAAADQDSLDQELNALFELEPIEFDTTRATLRDTSLSTLDEAASIINASADVGRLRVVGHTDSDGGAAKNQDLSERRAQGVVDHLVSEGGVDAERLEPEGRGESELLLDPDSNAEDKQRNRRIEWELIDS